jgi:hypothetical protein
VVTPPAGWNIAADLGAAPGVAAAFETAFLNVLAANSLSVSSFSAATLAGETITTPWSFNMPVHVPMSTASGVVLSDTP